MAENLLLDVSQTVMHERYNLDETEYKLFKYSEGAKSLTIGMTDGVIPVTVSFPIEFMVLEQMKRWSDEKKEMYLRNLIANERELDEELVSSFQNVMMKMEGLPSEYKSYIELDMEAGDKAIIQLKDGLMKNVTEDEKEAEVTDEEPVTKEAEEVAEEKPKAKKVAKKAKLKRK